MTLIFERTSPRSEFVMGKYTISNEGERRRDGRWYYKLVTETETLKSIGSQSEFHEGELAPFEAPQKVG